MPLDQITLLTFFLLFGRISACLMASPLFGGQVPVQVRVMLCGVLSFSLVPLMRGVVTHVPSNLMELGLMMAQEIAIGLMLGLCLQLLVQAVQMAGTIIDLQIGLSTVQLMNPMTGSVVSVFGQFKTWLALALLLIMNGHHLMITAFVRSYELQPSLSMGSMAQIQGTMSEMIARVCLIAVQIAAGPAAVALVIDIAAGVVNKSVPQMPVFMVAMPAKLLAGILALAVALPIFSIGVQSGIEFSMDWMDRMIRSSHVPR